MKMLNTTTKTALAAHLRVHADGPDLLIAAGAIEGLGELGGKAAISHLEKLIDDAINSDRSKRKSLWPALLRAYGRAGRGQPE